MFFYYNRASQQIDAKSEQCTQDKFAMQHSAVKTHQAIKLTASRPSSLIISLFLGFSIGLVRSKQPLHSKRIKPLLSIAQVGSLLSSLLK